MLLKDDLYERLNIRVQAKVSVTQAGARSSRDNLHRKGKGVIEKFGFKEEDYQKERKGRVEQETGTKLGLSAPTPDPRYNPPIQRNPGFETETATWTTLFEEEGRFEFSRVNEDANQEWISACEVNPKEWRIQQSRHRKQ